MFHFPNIPTASFRLPRATAPAPAGIRPLIALPFLLGLLFGSAVGVFSESPLEMLSLVGLSANAADEISVLSAIWRSGCFVVIAAFLATDVFGVILLPILSAARAFSFACCVAAFLQVRTVSSVLAALISFGLPALFNLPAFFLAESDAMLLSENLLLRNHPGIFRDLPLLRHFLMILFLCAADAAYIRFLLPNLVGLVS